jgi:Histidine phosphatase superfamily (branch 1)
MTKFLLIRHAAHDLLGKVLAGRSPGVHLNARGKLEAESLADRLAMLSISAIYTGPLERARETAEPLSNRLRLELSLAPAFDEIEFGPGPCFLSATWSSDQIGKHGMNIEIVPLRLRVKAYWQYEIVPRRSWNTLPRPVMERRWRS